MARNDDGEVSQNTRISIGFAGTILGGILSFIYLLNNLASQNYVDEKVKELRQNFNRDNEQVRKDQEYIKARVDDIYKVILDMKRR